MHFLLIYCSFLPPYYYNLESDAAGQIGAAAGVDTESEAGLSRQEYEKRNCKENS